MECSQKIWSAPKICSKLRDLTSHIFCTFVFQTLRETRLSFGWQSVVDHIAGWREGTPLVELFPALPSTQVSHQFAAAGLLLAVFGRKWSD